MAISTQSLFKSLEVHQILGTSDLKKAMARWNKPGREGVDDPQKLIRWLGVNHFLTAYQSEKLLQDRAVDLIHGPYRIKNRLEQEPVNGWLVGEDKIKRQVFLEPLDSALVAMEGSKLEPVIRKAVGHQNPQVAEIKGLLKDQDQWFLVREFFAGESLQSIIDRPGLLSPVPLAKLFALLFQGLAGLLEKDIFPGALNLSSLWVVSVPGAEGTQPVKTIKIVDAGYPTLPLVAKCLGNRGVETKWTASEAIFRLGVCFYHALVEKVPYPRYAEGNATAQDPGPTPAAIATLRPEIPEELATLVDELVQPVGPGSRENAGHIAKQLRVLLAAEETAPSHQDPKALHQAIVISSPPQKRPAEEIEEEASAADRFVFTIRQWLEGMGVYTRDLIAFTAGALTFLLILILSLVLFKWDLVPILCLGLGAGVGYAIERFFKTADSGVQVSGE